MSEDSFNNWGSGAKAPPCQIPCFQLNNISGKRNRTWWRRPWLCDRAGASVPRMDWTNLEGQRGPRLLGQEGRVSHHWFSLIVSRLYNFQDMSWESKDFYKNVIVKSKINRRRWRGGSANFIWLSISLQLKPFLQKQAFTILPKGKRHGMLYMPFFVVILWIWSIKLRALALFWVHLPLTKFSNLFSNKMQI